MASATRLFSSSAVGSVRLQQSSPAGSTTPAKLAPPRMRTMQLQASFFGTALPTLAPRQSIQRSQRGSLVTRAAQITVDVDKPLGLKLEASKSPQGGLKVKAASGNAAKAGISAGDTVIMTSSFFGDELWPADKLGFTQSALNAAPSPVAIVYTKGDNTSVDVKRLAARPAPKRFGRKLTAQQQELATHICVDCGYIYCQRTPFEELAPDWQCPQCRAPKKRFGRYDVNTGKIKGGVPQATSTIATVVGGLLGIGVLLYIGLNV